MKTLRLFLLLPLITIPLIRLLWRDRPGTTEASGSHTVEAGAGAAAETIPAAESGKSGNSVLSSSSGVMPAIPRNTGELNTFADGPLPLPDKMRVFAELMQNGTPEQAQASAMRAIFVVKNQDFAAHLQPLIVQGKVKPEAMDVMALNLYDRPLHLLLPAWAQILEQPHHPLAAAAADGLEFHLKEKAAARGPALAQAIRECLSGGRLN